MDELILQPAGDAAVMVDVGDRIDPAVNGRVRDMAVRVRAALSAYPRVEVIPAYAALLVRFDPSVLTVDTVEAAIYDARSGPRPASTARRRFHIPVCYGGDLGPDLEDVAGYHGISPDEVIARHANRDYPIYCLGFSPGFPYLGGLDPLLRTPRLETPRPRVPRGSVAIGGDQTGVYPTATPGGWRLIGRTPLVLFDVGRTPPVAYAPGDVIRFEAMTPDEYERVLAQQRMPEGTAIQS